MVQWVELCSYRSVYFLLNLLYNYKNKCQVTKYIYFTWINTQSSKLIFFNKDPCLASSLCNELLQISLHCHCLNVELKRIFIAWFGCMHEPMRIKAHDAMIHQKMTIQFLWKQLVSLFCVQLCERPPERNSILNLLYMVIVGIVWIKS